MATLTTTIPDAVVPRVQAAVGGIIGLKDVNGNPRPATANEVEAEMRAYLKHFVLDWETRVQKEAITVPETGL